MEYDVPGLPGWADSLRFDIEAKVDPQQTAALHVGFEEEQWHKRELMLQSLLTERFSLRMHYAPQERAVYVLVPARGGVKLQPSQGLPTANGVVEPGKLAFPAMPMDALAFRLSNAIGRPVIDRTGLHGNYAVHLHWAPDMSGVPSDDEPTIFTAIQEQLGLKLVPAKAPVESLVIDRLSKPSDN